MRSGLPRSTAVLAGAAVVAALLPATAMAEDKPTPSTRLVLSIKEEGSKRITVSLRCHPPTGDHPNRGEACVEIESAGGDFDKLPGRQTFAACPKIYLPIKARANGVAEGRTVEYAKTFANRCEMGVATGPVFEIWRNQ